MKEKRGNTNLHAKEAGKFDQCKHWDGQSKLGHEGERWEGTEKHAVSKRKELGFHEKGKK